MRTAPPVTALSAARDPERYGGKAAQLAAARAAGLPVPDGWALGWPEVEQLVEQGPGAADVEAGLRSAVHGRGPLAVRSSAVGEDSETASFAGAHVTVLGVLGGDAVVEAVLRVHASAAAAPALAYREQLGVRGAARMGVVVQEMVDADVAGVLFTRNPVTGADEVVIECSWGLGEAVVSGLVTPDHLRTTRYGRVLEQVVGDKDVAVRLTATGAAEERPVPAHLVDRPCLDDDDLHALMLLVRACDVAYAHTSHDIEFAFAGGVLHLLQRRPITHA